MGKKYKMIACEAVKEELESLLSKCENSVDVTFVTFALHSTGNVNMCGELQALIDCIEPDMYDALLLGYGLCSNGICTLRAPIPMVVPRAHDCITFFMGSRQRYRQYFDANPGTYFITAGTLESELHSSVLEGGFDKEILRAEYIEKYGEEDADYLVDMLGDPLKQYRKLLLIDNGIGDIGRARTKAKAIAADHSWEYEEFPGSTDLLARLINGDWDAKDFLLIPSGGVITQAFSEDEIIRVAD